MTQNDCFFALKMNDLNNHVFNEKNRQKSQFFIFFCYFWRKKGQKKTKKRGKMNDFFLYFERPPRIFRIFKKKCREKNSNLRGQIWPQKQTGSWNLKISKGDSQSRKEIWHRSTLIYRDFDVSTLYHRVDCSFFFLSKKWTIPQIGISRLIFHVFWRNSAKVRFLDEFDRKPSFFSMGWGDFGGDLGDLGAVLGGVWTKLERNGPKSTPNWLKINEKRRKNEQFNWKFDVF